MRLKLKIYVCLQGAYQCHSKNIFLPQYLKIQYRRQQMAHNNEPLCQETNSPTDSSAYICLRHKTSAIF